MPPRSVDDLFRRSVPDAADAPAVPEVEGADPSSFTGAADEAAASLARAAERPPTRAVDDTSTLVEGPVGVSLEIPEGWSEWDRSDEWVGLYSQGVGAEQDDPLMTSQVDLYAIFQPDHRWTAEDLAVASAEASTESLEQADAVYEDVVTMPEDELPPDTREVAELYWHSDDFEGVSLVIVRDDDRIIWFVTLNVAGYWDEWVDDYGSMLGSLRVEAAGDADDPGDATELEEACTSDRRLLLVAIETHIARKDSVPEDVEALVDLGYLDEAPKYHDFVVDPGADWGYEIVLNDEGIAAGCPLP